MDENKGPKPVLYCPELLQVVYELGQQLLRKLTDDIILC
jgi:hypothetical protein